MTSPLLRRSALGVATALTAAALVAIPSTSAQAAVDDPKVNAGAYFTGSGTCVAATSPSSLTSGDIAWTDNGVPVTANASVSGRTEDGADIVDLMATSSATVTSSPILPTGSGQVVIDASTSASAVPRLSSSSCDTAAGTLIRGSGLVNFTVPTWVTVSVEGQAATGGAGFALVVGRSSNGVTPDGDGVIVGLGGSSLRSQGSSRILLPAGGVAFGFFATADADALPGVGEVRNATLSARAVIDFKPAGFASAQTGKASKLVPLGLRDCAANVVPAVVTKKAAAKAKRVEVRVNGAKVVTLKGKKVRKRTLAVPVASGADALVTVTVVAEKKGKKTTTSRSYLSCTV